MSLLRPSAVPEKTVITAYPLGVGETRRNYGRRKGSVGFTHPTTTRAEIVP